MDGAAHQEAAPVPEEDRQDDRGAWSRPQLTRLGTEQTAATCGGGFDGTCFGVTSIIC